MFGKLLGRKKDRAIIHKTVPDEVLYPEGKTEPTLEDQSWMNTIPTASDAPTEKPRPVTPAPKPAQTTRTASAPSQSSSSPAKAAQLTALEIDRAFSRTPNAASTGRPPFPVGWMVVVEGPGVGNWFLLENGVSHIGSAEGQTIRLDFGDQSVEPAGHAAIGYDETNHGFVVAAPSGPGVRLNGIEIGAHARLRDGDVISLGGTSLRMVALCSPNFHWPSDA